jgi:hypothetical protein
MNRTDSFPSRARAGQHLRCGVYGGDSRCKASEVLSPIPSAACEVERIARGTKGVDRREQIIQTYEIKTRVNTLIRLGVVPGEVGDSACGWSADGGVVAVMVVAMEPAVKCAGALSV